MHQAMWREISRGYDRLCGTAGSDSLVKLRLSFAAANGMEQRFLNFSVRRSTRAMDWSNNVLFSPYSSTSAHFAVTVSNNANSSCFRLSTHHDPLMLLVQISFQVARDRLNVSCTAR